MTVRPASRGWRAPANIPGGSAFESRTVLFFFETGGEIVPIERRCGEGEGASPRGLG